MVELITRDLTVKAADAVLVQEANLRLAPGELVALLGPNGAGSVHGLLEGTYLHGAFASDTFRQAWLARAGGRADIRYHHAKAVDLAIDRLADGVEEVVDIDAMLGAAR